MEIIDKKSIFQKNIRHLQHVFGKYIFKNL